MGKTKAGKMLVDLGENAQLCPKDPAATEMAVALRNEKSPSQKGHRVAPLVVLSLQITQHLLQVHNTLSDVYSLSHASGALVRVH